MPPCLGSPAVAAVREAEATSSAAATTDPCARPIATPPYSSAFFVCRRGQIFQSITPAPRWQGVLTRLVDAPMRLERLAHLQRQFGLMSASLAIFSHTPS